MLFLKLVLEMHEHSYFVLIIGEGGNAYLCRLKC